MTIQKAAPTHLYQASRGDGLLGLRLCRDCQNRNFGHLDYVAIEQGSGAHLLRCPGCGSLYEDDNRNDPSLVSMAQAKERWSYRAPVGASFQVERVTCA